MNNLPDYEKAQLLLEKNEIFVSPAEAHGVISGLLACGLSIDDKEYMPQEHVIGDISNDSKSR